VTAPAAPGEPVVDQLAEVWTSLTGVCEQLDGGEWDRPTDCPGWSVKDNLSHLVGIERMLLGDSAPPRLAEVPPHVANEFGEMNEAWVDARRSVPGPEVLAEFGETTVRRIEALSAMSEGEWDAVGWSPVGEVPYRQFMETRVLDTWAHEQDMRRAVGQPGGRNGPGEATALDRCERTMPYVVGKRVAPPDGTSVLFTVTGALGRQIVVTMDEGRALLAPAPPPDTPIVELSMDQETFWRLGFGRVGAAEVLASGRVVVGGDAGIGRRVVESMPFMI
jgi:uncharacterized protein (TIGR03083 family)